ncbi:MAG: hypothetical protein ACLVJ6_12270 [Merdibacter sp.]
MLKETVHCPDVFVLAAIDHAQIFYIQLFHTHSYFLLCSRIHGVIQPVADHIEYDDDQHDGKAANSEIHQPLIR